MKKYVVNETVIRTTVINGEELVLGTKVRTPITEDNKVDALIYAMRFMKARIEGFKADPDNITVMDKQNEKNFLDLLFNGKVYCEIVWEKEGLFIVDKIICKLEEKEV